MKILIIGDLHGQKPKIHFKDFDCIVQVGDICDDSKIAPIYKKYFKLLKTKPNFNIDLESFLIKEIGKQKLKQYEKESLKKGREILKYLNSFEKPLFIVAGNWDQSYGKTKIKNIKKNEYNNRKAIYDFYLGDKINPKLTKNLKNIKNCMYKNYEFSKINFIGYGLSSAPEEFKHRDKKLNITKKQSEILKKSYNKLLKKIFLAHEKRNKKSPTIFITHNIPYNTKLDIIKDKDSKLYKKHFGSTIARKFCEKYQPLLCIGGHIHEGKGKDKIGKTTIINPSCGKDAQVLIEIKSDKIKKISFYKK